MAGYHEQLAEALTAKFIADGMDGMVAPTAAGLIADRVRLDHAGKVTVPVADTIAAVKAEQPALFQPVLKSAENKAADTRTAMQRDMDVARARAAVDRAGRIETLAQLGNPWRSATRNATRQAILQNLDPTLAARLQSEAHA